MNNKGFTIVEVVVAFSILAVVMLSVITFMITYRDKLKNAEVETQLLDYKNSLMKIIYDEIILGNYIMIDTCSEEEAVGFEENSCAYFLDTNGDHIIIGIKEFTRKTDNLGKGLYLEYDHNNYFLPDSDLNSKKTDRQGNVYNDDMCSFSDFHVDNDEKMQRLKISYRHYGLDNEYDMIFLIN